MKYRNRYEAGQRLALSLGSFEGRPDVTVLGLPRGGVPVAHEIARALRVALDVFVVRKLGLPSQREFAMGAIAAGGIVVLDHDLIARMRVTPTAVERVIAPGFRRRQPAAGTRLPASVGMAVLLGLA